MKSFHVLTSVMLILFLLVIVLCTDNPLILSAVFIFSAAIFIKCGRGLHIKKSLIYFIPIALITVIINFFFVRQGRIVLFEISGRTFTLESLVYAGVMSFKILIVIYIFGLFDVLIDSDAAVSYFSSIMPKSTLTMMICMKLFPLMKERFKTLKDIYSVRGVDFEGKGIKNQIRSYIPLLSIILEDSLENSFDIAEASYTRGFLSGKRTVYDRRKIKAKDYTVIIMMSFVLILYSAVRILGFDRFSAYGDIEFGYILNFGIAAVFVFLMAALAVVINFLTE